MDYLQVVQHFVRTPFEADLGTQRHCHSGRRRPHGQPVDESRADLSPDVVDELIRVVAIAGAKAPRADEQRDAGDHSRAADGLSCERHRAENRN